MVTYRLSTTDDPEERLEDAAMWKALHDEYGNGISLTEETPTFGRLKRGERHLDIPYWTDPAFIAECGRSFKVCSYKDAEKEVDRLHSNGMGAFLKSTRTKHAIIEIPVGVSFMNGIGDMAYSFMDGGPDLMIQEICDVEFEYRFFVINRQVVTVSPIAWHLTPLDYNHNPSLGYRTPKSRTPELTPTVFQYHKSLAEHLAKAMRPAHASIDVALINGKSACVEMNPMHLGNLGLYACDIRALVKASRALVSQAD